ncbi:hypothetical protein MASR2M47_15680 [Draconibacterium sp.]
MENNLKLKSGMGIEATGSQDFDTPGTYTFTIPPGVTSISVEAWGSGAGGNNNTNRGGGGGAYAGNYTLSVTAGTTYTVTVGAGAAVGTGDNGQASSFGSVIIAAGAVGANGGTIAASTGSVRRAGGNGGSSSGNGGAGGGGSAGGGGNGGNGGGTSNNTGGVGGTAGSAGSGTAGATGGAGGNRNNNGDNGNYPGGGGGERGESGTSSGGGGDGRVILNWNIADDFCYGYGYAVYAQSNVTNATNALYPQDNSGAQITSNNGYLDIDLTGGGTIRPSGSTVTIRLQRSSGTTSGNFYISSNGSTWTANGSYSISSNGWSNETITLSANTRYLRIQRISRAIFVDAISYCCNFPSQPSAITGNTIPCPSSSASYNVTDVPGITYAWSYSGTNANIGSGQGTNNINVTYAANATSGTWTVTPSDGACKGTDRTLDVTISTPSTKPTSVSGTNPICIGESTTLTTVGGTLGTEAENVWYEGGCANDIFTQEWTTLPYSVESMNVNSISGGIMSVTSTGADPMIHMENIGTFSAANYKYIQIRYRVTSGNPGSVEIYYSKNGGTDLSESQVVRAALVNDGNWNIVNVDMSTSPNWTGNITGWRYDWTSLNGVTMQLDFITLSNRPIIGEGTAITVSPTTTTSYYTRKKGACNSTNCANITVTVNPLPTITLGTNPAVCRGTTSANLTYSAYTGFANQYIIDYDATANAAGFTDVNITGLPVSPIVLTVPGVAAPATYNATLTVKSSLTGCVSSVYNFSVTVNPVPSITLGANQSVCRGITSANLTYSATTNSPDQYSIDYNAAAETAGFIDVTNASLSASPIVLIIPPAAAPATYDATLTVRNSTTGCISSASSMSVTVYPVPTMSSANAKTICSGANVNLALTSVVPSNYSWIATDNTNVTGESTTAQTSSTISDVLVNTTTTAQTVVYTVTPTSTTGSCPGTPQTVTITVNPVPIMSSANAKTICSGANVNLALTSVVPSNYSWIATDNTNVTGESTTAKLTATINDVLVNTTTSDQTVTYTVTPTSTTGNCPGTPQTVTITVNPAPTMNSANAKTICSGANVNLALTSVVPSTYSWIATDNTNVTGESITAQSTSTISDVLVNTTTTAQTVVYTVTPTSTTGSCPGTPQTVTITVNPTPTMSNANAKTICSGSNVNLALTSVVPSTYSWIATDNTNVTGESITAQSTSTISDVLVNTTTTAQTVVYMVTPTSTTGSCPGTPQTVTITVNPTPTMSNANAKTICSGSNVNLALTSVVPSTYSWIATDNTNVTGESITAQSTSTISDVLVNTTTSVQTVIYTVTPTSTTGTCPGTPQTVTITVNPAPTMNSANAKTICSGANVNLALTSVVASDYSWVAAANASVTGESTTAQTSSTISDVLVNTTTTAQTVVYTVTPTSTTGSCPGTPQTVTITVNPTPTMSNANTKIICSGTNVNLALTSVVNSTYSWVATANPDVTGESTTAKLTATINDVLVNTTTSNQTVTYMVTPTSTTGNCPGTPQTVTITVNPAPTMNSANAKTICSGANVNLALTSVVASDYSWVAAANASVTGESTAAQSTSTISDVLVNTTTSVQTVIYTVTPTSTTGTCPGTPQTVTITVNPVPIMSSANAKTICSGANVNLALTSVVPSNYSWIATDNTNVTGESTTAQTSSTISDVLVNTTTTAQTVVYTVTPTSTTGSCPGTPQTLTITVNPAPAVNIGPAMAVICQGGTSAALGGSFGGGATSAVWSDGGAGGSFTNNLGSTPGTTTYTASLSSTSPVTLTLTTSGGFCGNVSDSKQIDITPTVGLPTAITISSGTEPTCQLANGTTTTTYATTATNNTGFNWSLSNAAAGSINPTTGEMTWANGFTGSVDIRVTANGCNGPSAQATRTVNVSPTVGTPATPTTAVTTICQGSGNTTYTTSATNATSYNWSVTGTGNTISGTGTTGTVTWDPAFSGTATISVTANGCNGPSASASTTVTVNPTPTASISGTISVCQKLTPEPNITFTNPMALPVTITYNINGGSDLTINVAANSTNTVTAPTGSVGAFTYNLVSVKYQSAPDCSNTISGSATVIVRPGTPATPGSITGSILVLPAQTGLTYSIAAVANATKYNWTVPAGWNITAGQNSTSITVTSGVAGQNGNIAVTAENDCGISTASILAVTVDANLAIIIDPLSQTDCYYNTVVFQVTISGGGGTITYTWQRNTGSGWTNIVGDPDVTYPNVNSMLVKDIGSATNPGGTQYRVLVTDAAGTLTSNPATLTVNRVLTMTPANIPTTICEGGSATFSGTTDGQTPISYQWKKYPGGINVVDGGSISGATTTMITFTNAIPSDAGEYRLSAAISNDTTE